MSAQHATSVQTTDLLTDVRDAIRGARHDYTSGSLACAVLVLAVPMVLEMSMQSVFAVVDVYFVARLGLMRSPYSACRMRCCRWCFRSPLA